MSNSNEQRYIIEGLALGNDANNKIADVIASRSAAMLEQNLRVLPRKFRQKNSIQLYHKRLLQEVYSPKVLGLTL